VVVPIGVFVAVSGLRGMARLPEVVVSLLLASTIPPAYLVAVAGVSRARRGDQPDWQWLAARARHVGGEDRSGVDLGVRADGHLPFQDHRGVDFGGGMDAVVALLLRRRARCSREKKQPWGREKGTQLFFCCRAAMSERSEASGGGGDRTRVPRHFHASFYVRSRII